MSIEFAKKHEFKLKIFESTNILYHRYFLERTQKKLEIDNVGEKKWSVILRLAHHNQLENRRSQDDKMYRRQWILKQGKLVILLPHILHLFTLCLLWLIHVLGFVSFLTHIYCTLHSPHVSSVSASYSSKGILMFSSLPPYYFLKNTIYISHIH